MDEEEIIDEDYLPFCAEQIKPHFTTDANGQITYYKKSADRYHTFRNENNSTKGIPISQSKIPCQIQKDERFWTICATKKVFDHKKRIEILKKLLSKTFGDKSPLVGMENWEECLDGEIKLYFEACLPASDEYVKWLRNNIKSRQMVSYVLDAADRDNERTLEGPTHVDAMFLNVDNGFAWLLEAKLLSDISCSTTFDHFRNQIIRNIDVMLSAKAKNSNLDSDLAKRNPEKSLFSLLTPLCFKEYPASRLYGWLMQEYKNNPNALKRDLPHRQEEWASIQRRIGWITYEDFEEYLAVSIL